MKKIILFLGFVLLTFIPVHAYAGPPDCGELDREDVLDDTYSDARKLKYGQQVMAWEQLKMSRPLKH